MKKFLVDLLIIFVFILLIGETVVRVGKLYHAPIKRETIDGNYLPVPFQEGMMTKGKFKEINAPFRINNLGFNSIYDFNLDQLKGKYSIAIIGDSFIEGNHVDYRRSIGRKLEKLVPNSIVFEYGVSETNIVDYENLYRLYDLEKFDLVFVVFSESDLYAFQPDSIGSKEKGASLKNSFFRKIYDKSQFISYLNFNHAVFRGFKKMLQPSKVIAQEEIKLNMRFFEKKPSNVVPVFNRLLPDNPLQKSFTFNYIELQHEKKPYTYGFDKHWNEIGRENVANSLAKYITQHSNK